MFCRFLVNVVFLHTDTYIGVADTATIHSGSSAVSLLIVGMCGYCCDYGVCVSNLCCFTCSIFFFFLPLSAN